MNNIIFSLEKNLFLVLGLSFYISKEGLLCEFSYLAVHTSYWKRKGKYALRHC